MAGADGTLRIRAWSRSGCVAITWTQWRRELRNPERERERARAWVRAPQLDG